jgi:flavocytochrome c
MGAKIVLGTKVDRLLKNADGRVVGMEVRKHYRFPDESTGQKAFIQARKAVILASGGFAQNVELRMVYDPRVDARFGSTNHEGATGEVTLEACRIGAMDLQMDWLQLGPWTSPDEKGFGNVPQFCEPLVGYGLIVDPATGKRFIMETGNRKVRADAIMALNHPVLILADSVNVQREVVPDVLARGLEQGAVKKYDTIEALAAAYEIPVAALKDQIELWNSYVAKKVDPDFGCKIFPDTTQTTVAPFYAARLWPRVHFCQGGLVIDKETRVQSFAMKAIPGLFAAGECAGGIHGAVRLGSCSTLSAVVFGRIAGQVASKETPWA